MLIYHCLLIIIFNLHSPSPQDSFCVASHLQMTAQKRLCTNLHEKPKIYKDKKGVLNQTGKRNISPQGGMKKIVLIFFAGRDIQFDLPNRTIQL